jgi:hypothetical protein
MPDVYRLVALVMLPTLLLSSPVFAGQVRVVDAAALNQALTASADGERVQRDQVQRVLDRADVRHLASSLGLSLVQASAAVATLSGADLSAAAERAGALEGALAGGANTIIISTTTLLLIIIIIVLLAN